MTTDIYKENRMPEGALDLLKELPYDSLNSVLDIGTGNGYSAEYIARHGCNVVATGIGVDHWGNEARLPSGIEYCQADVTDLPFCDGTFDGIWMSHVLEHVEQLEDALSEVRRVLESEGELFISVPPYKPLIVGGHYIPGWTPGQLLYILLVNGFQVKNGDFFYYGYNVHARVKRLSESRFSELKSKLSYDGQELPDLVEFLPPAVRDEVNNTGNFDGITHLRNGKRGASIERIRSLVHYLKHALFPPLARRYLR
jgi:SAM-dependent methyltransferase